MENTEYNNIWLHQNTIWVVKITYLKNKVSKYQEKWSKVHLYKNKKNVCCKTVSEVLVESMVNIQIHVES